MLRSMEARVGHLVIDGITGGHGVPVVSENGKTLVELCAERGLRI